MEMGEVFANINFVAVLVSALSAFVVGWFWYGPLFGKTWMRLNGFTEESLKEGGMSMPVMMILNYLATALAALALAVFIGAHSSLHFGLFTGFVAAIFWVATNRLNDVLYERKPWGLYFINVGYNLVIYLVMGGIIGVWN